MNEPLQLTTDGREIPFSDSTRVSRTIPLSETQENIVAFARLHGGILRPVQAGTIVHRGRYWAPTHVRRGDPDQAKPCCRYVATDGCAALKRLIARGLVERISRGTYVLVGW